MANTSLFGMSPDEVQQALDMRQEQDAYKFASMPAGRGVVFAGRQAGGMFGNALESLGGYEDPAMKKAKLLQQVQKETDASGVQFGTAEYFKTAAENARKYGLPDVAMQIMGKYQEMQKQTLEAQKAQSEMEAKKAKAFLDYAQADKALRENPNLTTVEVGVAGKPDYRQKMIIDKSNPNMKPVPVGEPFQIPAGVRVSMGGGDGSGGKVQPVTVQDPDNPNRQLVIDARSRQLIGVGPKSAAAEQKELDKQNAIGQAESVISELRGHYDTLKSRGGIASTESGALSNIGTYLTSTNPVAQAIGSAAGTKNQSARQKVEMTRPLLLTSIMKATGMTSRQLDSNRELQLWLKTATDTQAGYEANMAALKNLENFLVNNSGGNRKQSGSMPSQDEINAELKRRGL